MTIRTKAIIVGLATLAGGCTITPRHDEVRVYQTERRVVHETDAYEGYYYVGIVYLNGIPWYVDEDLRARPVPPHLHSYFRDSSWARSMPPRFSRDTGMRDGYPLARVVYINEVPHYVDEDRRVRPIPSKLRSRFSYESVAYRDNGRRPAERPEPPYYRNETRPAPPAYGRERQEPATYGGGSALRRAAERAREEARPAPPAYRRDRQEPSAYEADNSPDRVIRTERMREEPRPVPPAVGGERQESSTYGGGNALGRAAERVREEPRPAPPAVERERQEPDNAPRREAAPERMREEAGRQGPPFARNDRMSPRQDEAPPAVRGDGGDERRGPPPAFREESHDIAQSDRGQASQANEGQRGMDVVKGRERGADSTPERKNGKGRGHNKEGQETDSSDRSDGDAGKRKGRE
jgi:hypothetical protein